MVRSFWLQKPRKADIMGMHLKKTTIAKMLRQQRVDLLEAHIAAYLRFQLRESGGTFTPSMSCHIHEFMEL